MQALTLITLCWIILLPAWCRAQPAGLCRVAVAAAERGSGVPDRLMQAISIIESGRRDETGGVAAWPWTINVEGVGEVFETKQQAIAAVTAHRARGARSIDVGCMQVNLMHHAAAFPTLEEAFDPAANARYAAQFLQQLLAQTGSWPLAVAGYHSLTPEVGGEYAKKVLAIWARPEGVRRLAMAQARPAPPGGPAPTTPPGAIGGGSSGASPGAVPSLPPASRLMSGPGSSAPQLMGRGLDSYRAVPTRLATAGLFRRS